MSVHYGLASAVVPPGGFHYQQILKDGKPHRLEGQGWPDLENVVLRFRLEQIALVDPERANPECVRYDIHKYVCDNFPGSCLDRWQPDLNPQPVTARDPLTFQAFRPLISRIAEWIGQLRGESFVNPAEADKRASICAKCSQNVRWETTCGTCVTDVRANSVRIIGTRKTRSDGKMAGCRKNGWLNLIAIWIDQEPLDDDNLPDQCWAKKR